MACAGLSQGAPQSDPSLARILQEQRCDDINDNDDSDNDNDFDEDIIDNNNIKDDDNDSQSIVILIMIKINNDFNDNNDESDLYNDIYEDNCNDDNVRFNAGAGKFGSAFAQEDGVVYREESVGNNERVGQYSYIGDDGKTYTVKYSAGINGFRSDIVLFLDYFSESRKILPTRHRIESSDCMTKNIVIPIVN